MQVLVRLVGADDHVYPNFIDVMQWLADSNLLEMIVDKLNPSVSVNVLYCQESSVLFILHLTHTHTHKTNSKTHTYTHNQQHGYYLVVILIFHIG